MIDDDVDAFLEHFGVKGMRWGVRKNRTSSGDGEIGGENNRHKGLSTNQRKAILGGAVVAGALVAGAILYHNKNMPAGKLRGSTKRLPEVKALLDRQKSTPWDDIQKIIDSHPVKQATAAAKKSPPTTVRKVVSDHQAFLETFKAKQNAIITDANKGLKELHGMYGGANRVFEPLKQWD